MFGDKNKEKGSDSNSQDMTEKFGIYYHEFRDIARENKTGNF